MERDGPARRAGVSGFKGMGRLRLAAMSSAAATLSLAFLGMAGWPSPASAQVLPGPDPCAEGQRLFQSGDLAAAAASLRACLQAGEQLQPLLQLAAIASLTKRPAEAGELAARALELEPESVEARYWLGRAHLEQGDPAAAEREWERGLAVSTDHPGVVEGLARLAIDRGQHAKAYGLLTQLVRLGKGQGWTHRLLADLSRRKGLWADALGHWRDAMALEGEDAPTLLAAGELAILAGDTAGAIAACRQAVELDPGAAAHGGLGEAYFAAHRYGEALSALQRAVELAPDNPRHRFNLANVLELLDESDEAEEHFRAFIALSPQDAVGHFNFGIHLEKRGRTLAALEQVEEASRLAPDMLTAQVVRGQLLEKLGRFEEAIAAVDVIMARDSENRERLQSWRSSLEGKLAEERRLRRPGQVALQHIVTGDTALARLIVRDLQAGLDFAVVATRYSSGPTAAQGGDIGFVSPDDMVEPLRSAIRALAPNETSPVVETKGLFHVFKRIR